jgi:hypothetical protein
MSDEKHVEPQDELSDEQLEQVAGGFDPQPDPPKQLVNKNSQPPSSNIADGTSNTIMFAERYP